MKLVILTLSLCGYCLAQVSQGVKTTRQVSNGACSVNASDVRGNVTITISAPACNSLPESLLKLIPLLPRLMELLETDIAARQATQPITPLYQPLTTLAGGSVSSHTGTNPDDTALYKSPVGYALLGGAPDSALVSTLAVLKTSAVTGPTQPGISSPSGITTLEFLNKSLGRFEGPVVPSEPTKLPTSALAGINTDYAASYKSPNDFGLPGSPPGSHLIGTAAPTTLTITWSPPAGGGVSPDIIMSLTRNSGELPYATSARNLSDQPAKTFSRNGTDQAELLKNLIGFNTTDNLAFYQPISSMNGSSAKSVVDIIVGPPSFNPQSLSKGVLVTADSFKITEYAGLIKNPLAYVSPDVISPTESLSVQPFTKLAGIGGDYAPTTNGSASFGVVDFSKLASSGANIIQPVSSPRLLPCGTDSPAGFTFSTGVQVHQ